MGDDGEQKPWRGALVQRVLPLIVVLGSVALGGAMLFSDRRFRMIQAVLWPPIVFLAVASRKSDWPYRLRAGALVALFAVATFVTYGTVGFQGNGPLLGGACVILAGLLFGRKAMLGMLGVLVAAPLIAAAGMLSGVFVLPPPAVVSLSMPEPWVRTTFVATAAWAMIGLSVTYFVEHIEKAVRTEQEAVIGLRAEQARREQAEQQRHEAERVAQQAQKLELVGRLSAGLAHDFNNVLAVIQAWSELAHKPAAEPGRLALAQEGILAAVRQGTALAQQLLAFGRQSIRSPRDVRLDQAVDAGVKMLRRVVPEGITVVLEHGGPGFVSADETELQQVLLNFVVNARDAMPGGGRLRVQTGVEVVSEERPVVRGRLAPGRWAFVSVADNGAGIDTSLRERIFEPFFTTKPVGMGTGLGLATVLHIARENGGAVALDSRPGAGSRFTLYLPEAHPSPAPSSAQPGWRESGVHQRPVRLLVLEPSVPVRELMQSVLQALGHTVVSAADGPQAMQAIRVEETLDLLCVDAVAAGEPASAVIAAFEARHPSSPVLIVSDHVQEELTRRGIEQGRYRLLRKPFAAGDLRGAVDDLLGMKAKRAKAPSRASGVAQAARVLVVDDDPLNAQVVCHVLRAAGYLAEVAATGEEALAALTRSEFDLVVLDGQLPGIDGCEAARRIRTLEEQGKLPSHRRLPIVGLSGSLEPEERMRSLEAGMDEQLRKPVESDRLLEVVGRHLGRRPAG
jgi:signal transduction histidine kinase/DNA-binding response OmpR family regulator